MDILVKNHNTVYYHKNIDKMIARNDSKYDKDSKFYFRNVFIVILGELY